MRQFDEEAKKAITNYRILIIEVLSSTGYSTRIKQALSELIDGIQGMILQETILDIKNASKSKESVADFMNDPDLKAFNDSCDNLEDMDNG